jgi:hypothetical protein
MSEFNLYLERVQENRNYKYQDLELYDEGFKEIWDKMKNKLKSLGKYATIIAFLLSAGSFDSIKKQNIPEELKNAKAVLLNMAQNQEYTLSKADEETLSKAIKFNNDKREYPGSGNWDNYVFDGSIPELIQYLKKMLNDPTQTNLIIEILKEQGPNRNVRPKIFRLLEGPNHKGL